MPNRASKILLVLMVAAATASAQEITPTPTTAPAQAPETTDASGILLAPKSLDSMPLPPVDSDGETRTVSAKTAAALSEGMPKFTPPTPSPSPTPEVQDMQEVDKPKNEIHRLPTYVVRETRPPIFRARDLYTQTGLIDLYFKNHPGLIIGNVLGLNSAAAFDMYQDDLRQANMDDLKDTAHAMAQGGDTAGASYILQQSQDTYMRGGGTWDWSATGPVGSLTGAGK